jgi:starch-binding outer membrane protein, SusD/RagB family
MLKNKKMIKRIIGHNTPAHRRCYKGVPDVQQHKEVIKFLIYSIVSVFFLFLTSCKKLVNIPAPSNQLAENNVYTNNASAISVLTGLYNNMSKGGQPFSGNYSIPLLTGLSSDELTLYSGMTLDRYLRYYQNALSPVVEPVAGSEFWTPLYNFVYTTNAAIEGLSNDQASALLPSIRQQLLGEAIFMRAFFYFYLVNLFGNVPMPLNTDAYKTTLLAKTDKAKIYEQIVKDLADAKDLLSDQYLGIDLLNGSSERVRPTKWAASAMMARVYLYTGEWAKAEAEATNVISYSSLFGAISSVPLNSVFLKNSKEAIWQIQPTDLNFNTQDARLYIVPSTGLSTTYFVTLSKQALNAFEPGDKRAIYDNWVDTTIYKVSSTPIIRDTAKYVYKYKVNANNPNIIASTGTQNMTEYVMILRLAEQYLIRAEARAQQGNIGGAQSDLNAIRNRAGLTNTNASDQASLLTAILHERQTELFCEGHRWFDLKRTGAVEAVMSVVTPLKSNGAPWKSYQQLYPILNADILKSPNLTQNPEYN